MLAWNSAQGGWYSVSTSSTRLTSIRVAASVRYVSIDTRMSTCLVLGVSPARTTLSEQAMHSTQSPSKYACGSLGAATVRREHETARGHANRTQENSLSRLQAEGVEHKGAENANVARIVGRKALHCAARRSAPCSGAGA
jgi:hypothetical protein